MSLNEIEVVMQVLAHFQSWTQAIQNGTDAKTNTFARTHMQCMLEKKIESERFMNEWKKVANRTDIKRTTWRLY